MKTEKKLLSTFTWLAVFSIAMGFMESAIVVYLRKIYYPGGFQFPLTPIDSPMGIIETLREAATLFMLVAIGIIAGKTKLQRFSFFLFCFAVWDIFYYVFLKLLIDWPFTVLDWDILFLIPAPWIGPVLAPCILSLTMILYAFVFTFSEQRVQKIQIKKSDWLMMTLGSIVIIYSFICDYLQIIFSSGYPANQRELLSVMNNFIPQHFNWWIFFTGEGFILLTLIIILNRNSLIKNLKRGSTETQRIVTSNQMEI